MRLQLQDHGYMGQRDVRHARHRRRRQARHDQSRRYQSRTSAFCSDRSYYEDWENARNVRRKRSARQSSRQTSSVESNDDSETAEARLRRQLHLGDVAALARQAHRRSSGARYRRRTDRALLGDGAGRACRYRLRQIHRPQREDPSAEDGDESRRSNSNGKFRNGATPSSAIARALTSRLTPRLRALFLRAGYERSARGTNHNVDRRSKCRTKPSAADSTKPCAECSRITS